MTLKAINRETGEENKSMTRFMKKEGYNFYDCEEGCFELVSLENNLK